MLLWQRSIGEIDHGLFRVVEPYFIGKSLGPFFHVFSLVIYQTPQAQTSTAIVMAQKPTVIVRAQNFTVIVETCFIKTEYWAEKFSIHN